MVRRSKQVVSNADLNVSVFIEHYELPVSLSKLAYGTQFYIAAVYISLLDQCHQGPQRAVFRLFDCPSERLLLAEAV